MSEPPRARRGLDQSGPSRARDSRSARRAIASVALAALVVLVAVPIGNFQSPPAASVTKRPNIVFILTDDLSWNLINRQFAPHIVDLAQRGVTFDHYFVADSLCCPSRSSIFTGLFPHDTHVETNIPPDGGFQKFQSERLDTKTFAVALHTAGYATSMLGKYLNGYGDPMSKATAPVPPGWTDWHVSNTSGYAEFNFELNDNGTVHTYRGPANYGVDVLNTDTQSFINRNAGKPFAVEVATFAPHAPFTPALRNAHDFPELRAPRDPSFNASNLDSPSWLRHRGPLDARQLAQIDAIYRARARAVESVDKLVADTEATLAARGLTDSTYIVFSSDNGYHLGEHRLASGKETAFDSDIRVPLIVAGPGVPHGRTVSQVAQNIDLYPTFLQLAGITPRHRVEGRSLVPLLHVSDAPVVWRSVALVEHHGPNVNPSDPDFEGRTSDPPRYEAIRISARHLAGFRGPVEAVYVEYADAQHDIEFYDVAHDRWERHNVAARLSATQLATLHSIVSGLEHCHSATACWNAGVPE